MVIKSQGSTGIIPEFRSMILSPAALPTIFFQGLPPFPVPLPFPSLSEQAG